MRRRIVKGAGGLLVVGSVLWILFTLAMRTKFPPVQNAIRRMNRAVMNPRSMETAGQPGAYASVVRHVGRTTGTPYETPVQVLAIDDGFVIPLPYGSAADWMKNVLAAGSAEIVSEGNTYTVDDPEIIAVGAAMPHVPSKYRWSLRLYGVDHFLRVRAASAPHPQRTMQAIAHLRYGSPEQVLDLREVAAPDPGEGEVLVRVSAAGVQAGDWHVIEGSPFIMRAMGFGLRKPKSLIPGYDVAGRVEAVGVGVQRLEPGDEVFGWCNGAFAEYVVAAEDSLALKPPNVTFEQAAVVPSSAFTALQGLRDHGKLQPGHRVLINGASGGVGTFAVQIAKALGADVTGVASTRNLDLVRSLGADRVIDYTQEDFTQSDERYDMIFDIAANHPLAACRGVLAPGGTYVLVGDSGGNWLGGLSRFLKVKTQTRFVGQQMTAFVASSNRPDLIVLQEFLETGKVVPMLDRTYPLREAPAAIAYVEEGHARAKVAITM